MIKQRSSLQPYELPSFRTLLIDIFFFLVLNRGLELEPEDRPTSQQLKHLFDDVASLIMADVEIEPIEFDQKVYDRFKASRPPQRVSYFYFISGSRLL